MSNEATRAALLAQLDQQSGLQVNISIADFVFQLVDLAETSDPIGETRTELHCLVTSASLISARVHLIVVV